MGTDFLSEEYLTRVKASIVESHKDFIGIADTEGRLIYLNEAAYQMMGYGAEDRPHFNTIADVHANDFDKFALEVIQPAVFANGAWSGMGFIKHKSGKALTVAQQVFPVYDEDGTVYGTVGIMRDISEIAELNRQLDVKNEIFQKVMDTAKVGIVLINMQTNTIEMANSCTQELLQKDASEIVGQKCYDVLCHRDPSICPHINERDKASIVAERFLERSDGSMLPIIKTGTWIDIEGKEYLVDTLVDITIQKELEKNLIEAKISAEAANRSKSEFLSRMSHEMRTPLSAIIGMMNVAKASSDIAKKEYCLDKIEDASKHLLGVINDILDMSKIEANKFELLSAPFHFEKMLTRVINVINFRVDEKKQELVVNIDERIPTTIFSDEQRLAQVITNLLANAVKFTPDGGLIWLNAHLLYERDDVLTLQFDIRDTGIGISKEQQSRLFHSFEQADGGIARKYGGTGLGLAISKRIVGLMGGEIWIESDISQGTTVSFTIETQCNHSIAHEHVRNITWDMLRVLVVDDAPEVLTYFNSIAKNLHLSCDTVSNGAKAMHMLESGTYNIVFVDYQTPDTDGIVLMRRLKKFYASQAVVIMASVAEWSEIEEAAKQVGIMHVLHKPLMPSQIIDCINTVLGITSMPIPSGDAPVRNRTGLFAGHTILLAEDVAINREIVLSLLEDTGVQIDCAQNGSEAVRLMLDNPARYDMIFMDIHMPEMDGFEATRRIRALAHPGAKAIPIVAMTANVFREDVEKCLAAGMNDHIGKPVDIDEIIARMEPYLLGK